MPILRPKMPLAAIVVLVLVSLRSYWLSRERSARRVPAERLVWCRTVLRAGAASADVGWRVFRSGAQAGRSGPNREKP